MTGLVEIFNTVAAGRDGGGGRESPERAQTSGDSPARVVVDIGSWFAYNTASLSKRGILIRRKQMAKKTLKKAKKLEATKPLQSHAPFKK
jgi:hypothetical protein